MMRSDYTRVKAAFGARLRALRNERRMSQEDLGGLTGLDRTYIGSVERGERNVSLVNIYKLADGLGIRVSELLGSE